MREYNNHKKFHVLEYFAKGVLSKQANDSIEDNVIYKV